METLAVLGSVTIYPVAGDSGDPFVTIPIDERMWLSAHTESTYTLTSDAVQTVSLGGLTNAHALVVRATGGKVKVRITSADGSAQSIPVDSLLILTAYSVPITAVDVTRVTGTSTIVKVLMGQR